MIVVVKHFCLVSVEFWYFKPPYQGLFSSYAITQKDSDDLTLGQIRDKGNAREVACVLPISHDILHVPKFHWYKDGVPVSLIIYFIKIKSYCLTSR